MYVIGLRVGRAGGMAESKGEAKGQSQGKGCMMLSCICGWCNVPLHHSRGLRFKLLPQYTWPALRAKVSVCFFSSHYVIVPSFPIVVTYPIMSLFSPVPLSHAFYCIRLHCISIVKYCCAPKWDGSLNIKLILLLLWCRAVSHHYFCTKTNTCVKSA